MTPRVVVVRHAPVREVGVCYGRYDVEVSSSSDAAGVAILTALGAEAPVMAVWSSPSLRCRLPAAVVSQRIGVSHRIDERLSEMSFGEWEGRRWQEIEETDGGRLSAWMTSWQTGSPPGGETVAELTARVHAWYAALKQVEGRYHLVVAHAGVMRALRVITGACDWAEAMARPVTTLTPEWFGDSAGSEAC